MTSSITAAGSASGYDFESIITASVEAKQTSLEEKTTEKRALLEIEISGVSQLKEALSAFQDVLEELTEDNSMNTHKVTTDEDSDYNVFDIECEDDCANMSFDITVTQLASSAKVTQTFTGTDDEEFSNSFAAGTITIDLGEDEDGNARVFTIEIEEGDTLELIRKRINQNDYGVTCSLVQGDDGYTLVIDTGTTGSDTTSLTITTTTTGDTESNLSLDCFNFSGSTDDGDDGSWTYSEGTDCIIYVDGLKISSSTNEFDDGQISGISLTVNRLSETEEITTTDEDGNVTTTTGYKSYSVSITSDTDAATEKMQSFVDAYNTLMETLEALYTRNTYTDGENNYDGGDLAGDSQLASIKSAIQKMISSFSSSVSGKTIFSCGLEFESDGTLSLDEDEFEDALETAFASVVELFTGDDGLLSELLEYVEDYTETAGILDERTDTLEQQLDDVEDEELENEEYLELYEAALRQKYAYLDTLIASLNNSLSYISSAL